MLSIPVESRYAPLGLTSVQMKVQNLFVLADLLLSFSLRRPVFCLVEDAQWMDPSTKELLDLLVTQIETSRVLLVVTYRRSIDGTRTFMATSVQLRSPPVRASRDRDGTACAGRTCHLGHSHEKDYSR